MSNENERDGNSDGGWVYSDIVKEHFLNPRNFLMGDEKQFDYDAVGLVGNPICGDQMKMYIKVGKNASGDEIITDIRWKTYGCASAIASTSALSELAKGKTLDAALEISAKDIDDYLGNLPKHKFHCSILGHDALRDAINNYRA
ncbi:iron-sulfur cluster assembly scaffold protein [Candidatus Saccharibacteria bacterium]|nr:iron-sulfur cluster assembly scaffold protein [Candidatus Saccharibacteria bacterium]